MAAGGAVQLGSADTVWKRVPHDTTFDIRVTRRFYVEVFQAKDGAVVTMRV